VGLLGLLECWGGAGSSRGRGWYSGGGGFWGLRSGTYDTVDIFTCELQVPDKTRMALGESYFWEAQRVGVLGVWLFHILVMLEDT
jgi:hypothetical protein